MRHYVLLTAVFGALCMGCPSTDELTLTSEEAQELSDHTEVAIEAQHRVSDFAFLAARGDLDLSSFPGFSYDPPTEENGWTGRIDIPGGAFPFGTGNLDVTFHVQGDGVSVDPYATDISSATNVVVDAVVNFEGVAASTGLPLSGSGDFDLDTVTNAADAAVATVNGTFDIDYDGYLYAFTAADLELSLDTVTQEITNVLGEVRGTVDIPDFAFDADFVIEGLGNSVEIGLDVVATTIDYVVTLEELF